MNLKIDFVYCPEMPKGTVLLVPTEDLGAFIYLGVIPRAETCAIIRGIGVEDEPDDEI